MAKPERGTLPQMTTEEAAKVVEALNHTWREVFDQSPRGEILIKVARHIAAAYDTGHRV